MKKRNGFAVLAAVGMLFGTVGVAHADTPINFSFGPASGPPGTVMTVTGTGCTPSSDVTKPNNLILQGQGTTPSQGPFNFTTQTQPSGAFTFPVNTTGFAAGSYLPVLSCPGNPDHPSALGTSFYTVTVVPVTGATYVPLTPTRILDTRNGTGTGGGSNPVGPGATIDLQVTGVGGVPASGVAAVALNVTATGATGPGSYLTIYPTGSTQPLASNLNFNPGTAIPNLVIARVGPSGKVSIYNNLGSVHVVGDVQGYYADSQTSGSTYVPVNPLRVLDTRTGTGVAQAQVPAGGTISLAVAGVNGVPANATAVVLNMTTTQATGPESFLSVYPSDGTLPTVSNLNFTSGPPSTNAVVARVGTDGKVKIYNNLGSTDVVADLNGYFAAPVAVGTAPPGQVYYPINPVRALDTRNGTGTPGGVSGQLGAGNTIDLAVAGVGGVSTGATAVVLNVTAADSPGPESYLTLFPSGTARPLASNLNFVAQQTVPNLVMVRLNNGKVSIYNNLGSVAVIADIQGFYAAAA